MWIISRVELLVFIKIIKYYMDKQVVCSFKALSGGGYYVGR